MFTVTDYFDNDTEQNYAIMCERELTHEQRREAVLAFKPCDVIHRP